jgi:carboxyl-terminal processing protease
MFRGRTVLAFVLLSLLVGMVLSASVIAPQGTLTDWIGWNRSDGGSATTPGAGRGLTDQEIRKLDTTLRIVDHSYLTEVDRDKLVDGAIQGMLSALNDPYTVYISPDQHDEYSQGVDAYFTGIGAEVSLENGKVVVVAPIKGSPAEKAGIRPKDIILSVNGETLEGLSLTEAVAKIRGPKGTQARLLVQREGQQKPFELILVRDEIDLETVFSEMLEGDIGKIEIRQFSVQTVDSFRTQLADLEKQGMKGLIIDVRNNPGGYLEGVAHILYTLVPEGKILLQTEDRNQKRDKLLSEGPGRTYPMAVLINGGSASASEILAAAVQQSAGGVLVGEKTYGKGTVQSQISEPYEDGSLLKISVAKWLTPDGSWIHEKGVKPNIEVKQPDYFYVAPIHRDRVWKPSDIGEDVKNMQIMLRGIGYAPDRQDGYFSTRTAEELKKFQSSAGLEKTGQLDEATIEQLERAVIERLIKPENDRQLQEAIKTINKQLKSE